MLNLRAFFYILKAIFLPFLMCLLTFFSLIFIFQFLQNSKIFFQDSSSLSLVLQIFTLLGVSYLPLVIPFCLLFGILFGHGRLSGQSEFTAFASFGISKWQLVQPACFFTLICTVVCFNSIHTWGPSAKFKSRSLEYALKKKIAVTAFQPGVFLTQIPNVTMYAEDEDSQKNLKNIFIVNNSEQPYTIFSNSGKFIKEGQTSNLGIDLYDGEIYSHSSDDSSDMLINFRKYFVQLFRSNSKNHTTKKIGNRSSRQLRRILKTPGKDKNISTVELYKRNTFALSCFFFLVLGSLFSLRLHNRSSTGSGFMSALIIAMFFWMTLFTSEFLAASMNIPLIMYSPILICSLLCLASYKWIKSKSII